MGEKIVVGPINKGFRNDRTAFVIDNDSFPTLINAYQWRGRVKRKRGTSLLTRLARFFNSLSPTYNSGNTTITLNGSGVGNLLTGFIPLQTNASIDPTTVTITAPGPTIYTDPNGDGTLSPSGSINYATGQITILAAAGQAVSAKFTYFPTLPVLGLEDLVLSSNAFPGCIAFDPTYSYNIQTSFPYSAYDVSFYKNPATNTYPGYVQKATWTPTTWNGQDYQQFWTTNYQGALWATNGINIPFNITNIGMQYAPAATITYNSNTATTINVTIANCPLIVGDFVFLNEWTSATPGAAATLNLMSGYVTACAPNTPTLAAKTLTITFPVGAIAAAAYTPGIIQYLTNRSDVTKDCLRWYDGDPTNGNATNPTLSPGNGWVNFAPPLSSGIFSIEDNPAAIYYLVGARMIVPFKDQLLFLGPVIQTSALNSQIYVQDAIIFSQNGTPYYTAAFTANPLLPSTPFTPVLTPTNQTASPISYFEDVTGFGGYIAAGVDQAITTVSSNEDVLIIGFSNNLQTRLVFSGNAIVPFNFYIINSELPSDSTFSVINLDKGVMTRGNRGYIVTSQVESKRFDLEIPDEVFEINLLNNGTERVTAQRDFINEWIYFSYPSNDETTIYPNQTLQYNYRDDSWALFNESYTTYGQFKKQTGYTWANIGLRFQSWESWNEPWNSGASTLLHPKVIGGNQQGFVLTRDEGTAEGNSLAIQNISGTTITCPNHCLNEGDYIVISGALGTVSTSVNGKIFKVSTPITANTFTLSPGPVTGTYSGLGVIQRMYIPFIQTKQFPVSWGMGRKTRLGPQQYLFSSTANGQVTLLIFLSQDSSNPYNDGPVIPAPNSDNNSLIYSNILYTCPESTNLGLTPANINLNMITAPQQAQIWHRLNTSLLGDTVQVGFTLSPAQMTDPTFSSQFSEIELHSFILDVSPSQLLA